MPRPKLAAAKPIRTRVNLPGILGDTLRQRWEEFRYPGFSPFALELICFDLRLRVPHEVTARFARESRKIQAAIDRLLVRDYRGGGERDGVLIHAARGVWREPAAAAPRGEFAKFHDHVRYSEALAPCIEIRWREAGYATFSDYVLALLRYDLMLLGPHLYYNGDDTDPEILASLDRGTVAEFHENRQPKRIYLDRELNLAAGRELSQEELSARKLQLAEELIERAVEADRRERKG
jgi:hypothetical protein